MPQAHAVRDAPEPVQASLDYLAARQRSAIDSASVGGGEVAPHESEYVAQAVTIRNGRVAAGHFSLDREG